MGDNYNIDNTQAGAIGKNASAVNTIFNNNESKQLHAEFLALLKYLSEARRDAEQEKDLGLVHEAALAAQRNEPGKVKKILQATGKWVGEAVKELGLGLLKKLIFNE